MTSKSDRILNRKKIKKYENQLYRDINILSVYLEKLTLNLTSEFKVVLNLLLESDIKKIIIDISLCRYVSFSFWCSLLTFSKNLENTGGKLVIVCDCMHLQPVISHTGVDKIFSIQKGLDTALDILLETPKK